MKSTNNKILGSGLLNYPEQGLFQRLVHY